MLEQLSSLLTGHPRVRQVAPLILLSGAALLYWLAGGFPPRSWMFLAETTPQMGYLWDIRGPIVLLPFLLMVLISLSWLAGWGVFVWSGVALANHWLLSKRTSQPVGVSWFPERKEQTTLPLPTPPQAPALRKDFASSQRLPGPGTWDTEFTLGTEVGAGWDSGTVRRKQPNEDNLLTLQGSCPFDGRLLPFSLFVVADGMGGHANGKEASHIAVQRLTHTVLFNLLNLTKLEDAALIELLLQAVQQANKAVYQRAQEAGAGMGTTITAVLVVETIAYVVNVGDSRTYLYRPGSGLSQITRDHSVVAHMVETGLLKPEEIYTHPDRNQVYRGLGDQSVVEVDWFTVQLQIDDYLLLCSDGLWEMVRDREIERIMRITASQPARVSATLVQAALESGGSDNISVVAVHAIPSIPCRVG